MLGISSELASPIQGVTPIIPSLDKKRETCSDNYMQKAPRLRHGDYTIGWICALHIEMAAARAMLDCVHKPLPMEAKDSNAYVLGHIGPHNIAMACLPVSQYGTNSAANVANNMNRSFPSIRIRLVVGIGGGVPISGIDLRLGDVVVGCRVMQYDMGKVIGDGKMVRTAIPRISPPDHSTHVSSLRAIHEMKPSRVPHILQEMHDKYPGMTKYTYPDSSPDRLFRAAYDHEPNAVDCSACIQSNVVNRTTRTNCDPTIHYGGIASGNQVMKHGITRDDIARKLDVICFEMEAAGLMDYFPCLAIRGICDYSDSHKNKQWQEYAAATAAAYAKELLEEIPSLETAAHQVAETTPNTHERYLRNRREKILNSLKFDQIASRQSNIEDAHGETCNWLLDHPTYLEWLEDEKLVKHYGILWLSGKPGAGKSTIMKFVSTRLKKTENDTTSATISFFFNARGEILEKSTTGMYRSLLLQLLEAFPDLQRVFDSLTLIPENRHECPTTNTIRKLFHSAVLMLNSRTLTCLIDALDECDEQQVRDMVEHFEELGRDSAKNNIQFRICFSSRHYPYIYAERALRLTLEGQKGHSQDLEQYVRSRLKLCSDHFSDIRAQILNKAAGVFMWVVLVVNILNAEFDRGRIFAVRKRLQELPAGLSDLFKTILRRDNENMQELLLGIQWLLYAKRPLKPEEFYFAVLSGLPDDSLSECDASRITRDITGKFVISSSKGLAEVTKSEFPTVQFIHESVPDFLLKDGGLLELLPNFEGTIDILGHDTLKKCCYAYFKLCIPISSSVNKLCLKGEQATLTSKFPFSEYALLHMLYHANIAASGVSQRTFLSQLELRQLITLNNCNGSYSWSHTPNSTLIYLLAAEGLSNLILTCPHQDSHIDVPETRYRYPLFAALVNGREDAVRALLGWDTYSTNEEDIMRPLRFGVYGAIAKRQTPLHWMVSNNQEATARQLLKMGTNINARDCDGNTALMLSLCHGYEALSKLLIENGADINARDRKGNTGLLLSLHHGRDTMMTLLIEHGADIDARDHGGRTALLMATKYDSQAIMMLLLRNGADINARDHVGRTALLMATIYDNPAIAKLLVASGADVNSKDSFGNTAMKLAILYENMAIVEILTEKGRETGLPRQDHNELCYYGAIERRIFHKETLDSKGSDGSIKCIY